MIAAFDCAARLFGLRFEPRDEVKALGSLGELLLRPRLAGGTIGSHPESPIDATLAACLGTFGWLFAARRKAL